MMSRISEVASLYENDGVPLHIAFSVAAIYTEDVPLSSLRDSGLSYDILTSDFNGILRVIHHNRRYDFDLDTGDLLGFVR
jgi:hypothetical protein